MAIGELATLKVHAPEGLSSCALTAVDVDFCKGSGSCASFVRVLCSTACSTAASVEGRILGWNIWKFSHCCRR